jgi:tetratricopeptide (TPR) repeat protein
VPVVKIDISGILDHHYKRGMEYIRQNRIDDAINEFKKSTEIAESPSFTYEQLGNCYNEKGEYGKAIKFYELAIQGHAPAFKSDYLFFNKSLALKKLGRYRESIQDLEEVLKKNPKFPNAWTLKSNCHRAMRAYEEAINCLDKELELNPKNLLAFKNKSTLLAISGKQEKAQEIFNESLMIEPDDFQSWCIKGENFIKLGNFKEATTCFNKANALSEGHPYTRQLCQSCNQKRTQYDEIRKKFPQNALEWNGRGIKLYSLGVYIEALGSFEKAINLSRERVDFRLNGAITLSMLHRFESALEEINKVIEMVPNDANVWNQKGDIFFRKEKYHDALNCYEKAFRLDPNLEIARKNKESTEKLISNEQND